MFKPLPVLLLLCFTAIGAFAQAQVREKTIQDTTVSPKPSSEKANNAKKDDVKGTVKLSVIFLASGEIGDVKVVEIISNEKGFKENGLLEQATAAAKKIKFEPPKRNGKPYSVKKIIIYTFTIY